jgi:hypothetical protein
MLFNPTCWVGFYSSNISHVTFNIEARTAPQLLGFAVP